jgi:TonB family protein
MKTVFTLTFLLGFLSAFAQPRQNVYYFKNNGRQVDVRDSADYVRIIQEPDSGSVLYKLNEYNLNGSKRRTGLTSTIEHITLQGVCTSYFANGNRRSVLNYNQGLLVNEQYHYYANGKLAEERNYPEALNKNKPEFGQVYLINTYNDSLGTPLVVNGNGHYKTVNSAAKSVSEGDIKDGLKEGNWKTSIKNDSLVLTETYAKGKFISGIATMANGESYTYNKTELLPQFKGGMQAFYSFLNKTLRYPTEAYRNKIQGRVLLSFVIEADGSLNNITQSGKSPDPLLTAEAIRVMKLSPKWEPGIQYGRAVRVKYTVPIMFNLR